MLCPPLVARWVAGVGEGRARARGGAPPPPPPPPAPPPPPPHTPRTERQNAGGHEHEGEEAGGNEAGLNIEKYSGRSLGLKGLNTQSKKARRQSAAECCGSRRRAQGTDKKRGRQKRLSSREQPLRATTGCLNDYILLRNSTPYQPGLAPWSTGDTMERVAEGLRIEPWLLHERSVWLMLSV